MDNLESVRFFYPELILTILVVAVVLIDLVSRGPGKRAILTVVTVLGLLVAFTQALALTGFHGTPLFTGMVVVDPFALFFEMLAIVAAAVAVVASYPTWEIDAGKSAEFIALLLVTVIGISLLAAAVNLLMIYLAFEMVSVPCYILAGLRKRDPRSNEASLKYVVYGAVSTGLMLYGLSLLYGLTGTLDLGEIHEALAVAPADPLTLFVSGLLILSGFGYKMAAVPFHFWSPDVYEGAPTPVTAFLSVGPKAAGFAIFIRFFYVVFGGGDGTAWFAVGGLDWPALIAVISALTMTLGNLTALRQKNLKRLLAYSSIAHAGYLLMGVAVLSGDGLRAVLFYFAVYLFMNLGAFLVVIAIAERTRKEEIDDYAGLGTRAPFVAVAMTVFLFSLTGIPPTGGFVGKFYLFAAVIQKEIYWLAVVGIVNSVISLYYYARIMRAMYFARAGEEEPLRISPLYTVVILCLVVPTLLFGVYWAPLARFVQGSFPFLP